MHALMQNSVSVLLDVVTPMVQVCEPQLFFSLYLLLLAHEWFTPSHGNRLKTSNTCLNSQMVSRRSWSWLVKCNLGLALLFGPDPRVDHSSLCLPRILNIVPRSRVLDTMVLKNKKKKEKKDKEGNSNVIEMSVYAWNPLGHRQVSLDYMYEWAIQLYDKILAVYENYIDLSALSWKIKMATLFKTTHMIYDDSWSKISISGCL